MCCICFDALIFLILISAFFLHFPPSGWYDRSDPRKDSSGAATLDRRLPFYDIFVTKRAGRETKALAEHEAELERRRAAAAAGAAATTSAPQPQPPTAAPCVPGEWGFCVRGCVRVCGCVGASMRAFMPVANMCI